MQKIIDIPKLTPRKPNAHKGDFGKVLIVAGSLGMSGAAAIAGRSALRAGAGLVKVALPRTILPIVAAIEPSFTTLPLPDDATGFISAKAAGILLKAVPQNDVVAIGPGIGIKNSIKTVLQALLNCKDLPLVIDADGLNNLAAIKNWSDANKANLILTPHPGEMKRLWKGLFREPMPADRTELAARFAERTRCVVCLKGHRTVVTDAEKVYVNTTGNPGMATAGAGDVLTGTIAALLGQHLTPFDAAVLGVYTHGLAGDIAAEKLTPISLIATDIIDALPQAFSKCAD